MTQCNQQPFGFQALRLRRVEAYFNGGHLSSDGGSLLLREMDRKLAACFVESGENAMETLSFENLQ